MPSVEEVAYALWEARGRPVGEEWDDWFEAERQLRARGASVPLEPAAIRADRLFMETMIYAPAEILELEIPPPTAKDFFVDYDLAKARRFLVAQCLREVQKAGFAAKRWLDFVDGKPTGDTDRAFEMDIESLASEQSVWQRKLGEALVLLIGFSATPSDAHFLIFLRLLELERVRRERAEQVEYFGCRNAVLQEREKQIVDEIHGLVSQGYVKPEDCWFIAAQGLSAVANEKNIKVTKSTTKLIEHALIGARPTERGALGYCLQHAFSEPSEAIHFAPLPGGRDLDLARFRYANIQIGRLGIAVVARSLGLLKRDPPGRASRLAVEICSRDPTTHPFRARAESGDFGAVIYDRQRVYLAEVTEVVRSRHGNESLRIRYLGDRPIPGLDEDSVMPDRVGLFQKRADLVRELPQHFANIAGEGGLRFHSDIPSAEVDEALRFGVLAMWNTVGRTGLLEHLARTAR